MLIGFTPIDGYTPFISEYLKNAETLKTRPAKLLNNKAVPIEQYSPNRDARVVYLHSDENPFGGYDRIAKDLVNQPDSEIYLKSQINTGFIFQTSQTRMSLPVIK
mgnify:CR=1 FL=1